MNHVPHELLLAFAEGDLDETLATHIADHIDGCGTCLARATALEPLSDVFAEVPDPAPPARLVEQILAAAARADDAPRAAVAPSLARSPTIHPTLPGGAVPSRSSSAGASPAPRTEIAIGLALLLVAAALSIGADPAVRALASDPAEMLSRAGALLEGLRSVGHTVRVSLGAGPLGLAMAAGMALFGLYLTVRVALTAGDEPLLKISETSGGAQ